MPCNKITSPPTACAPARVQAEACPAGGVADEAGGVDDRVVQDPGGGELHGEPVVAVVAAAGGFPSVGHDRGATGGQGVQRG